MLDERLTLGVDLGSTKTSVTLWAGDRQLARSRWPTTPDPCAHLDRIVGEARRLQQEAGTRPETLQAIGVSGGGPVDATRGVLLSVPNLPGWDDLPVCELLSRALGAPARMENDANACALAEWRYGAGRGVSDLVFLTCSTGIGAGIIAGGELLRGASGLAGEAGHQVIVPDGDPCGCGNRGCLETYASGAGMARRLAVLRAADPGLPSSARDVVGRARQGDPSSLEFLEETARYLALGLANLIYVLNPARVILGTIAVGAGELLLVPLRRELARRVWPRLWEGVEVLPAELGDELGDRAALAVARGEGTA